jgi:hypothetical protein
MNKENQSPIETNETPAAAPASEPKKMSRSDDELITALFDLLSDIKEKRPIKAE